MVNGSARGDQNRAGYYDHISSVLNLILNVISQGGHREERDR